MATVPVAVCGDAPSLFEQGGNERETIAIAVCLKSADGDLFRVRDGASVYPGEELTVTVRSARPIHVQLLQWQHGLVERLWPPGEGAAGAVVTPDRDLIVPDSDFRLILDRHVGPITLFVVASGELLHHMDAALDQTAVAASKKGGQRASIEPKDRRRKSELERKQTKESRSSATETPAEARKETEALMQAAPVNTRGGLVERGIVRERIDTAFVVAEPDRHGVALIEFHLNHVLPTQ